MLDRISLLCKVYFLIVFWINTAFFLVIVTMEIWRYRLSRGENHGQHQSNVTQSFGFCRNIKKISINSHSYFVNLVINKFSKKTLKNWISHSPTFVLIWKKKSLFFCFLNMKFWIMQSNTCNVFNLHIRKVNIFAISVLLSICRIIDLPQQNMNFTHMQYTCTSFLICILVNMYSMFIP